MDLLLVVSPVNALYKYMPFYYLYLAGYLEKFGYKVGIADPHFKKHKDNVNYVLNMVKETNPKYIGFSSFVTDYNVVNDLAAEVKKISKATTLVGNAQPSIMPQDFLYNGSPFDIVVRGEGELTAKAVLDSNYESTKNIKTLYTIDGISFFDPSRAGSDLVLGQGREAAKIPEHKISSVERKKGSVVINKNRKLMSGEDWAMPAYHLIDMSWYLKPDKYLIRRLAAVTAGIYTGRGCPYKCNFCAANAVWHTNDKDSQNDASFVRWRPMEKTMEDLSILQNKFGFDFFYIHDDTFGINPGQVKKFCTAYKASGLKMLWAAETRVTCIKDPEIVKLLRESGCVQLDFGVESGSPRMLKLIQKMITVPDIERAFELCHKYGMRAYANIMVNLSQEDHEDLIMSKDLVKKIKPTQTGVGIMQPYPGTGLYRTYGFKIPKSEYHLLDRMFPPEKWRMAKHKVSLRELAYDWILNFKVESLVEWSMFRAGPDYWKKIFTSKHRFKYIFYITKSFIGAPYSYIRTRWENYKHLRHGWTPDSTASK